MSRRFARPYAQALLSTAGTDEAAVAVRDELARFAAAMNEVPALAEMAANPAVPLEVKEKVVSQVVSRLGLGELGARFVLLLLSRYRLQRLPTVLAVYETMLNRRLGIATADVRTATRLADVEEERLRQTLERMLEQKVELKVRVVPELLAGFTAQVGSTLYDASLQGQLERLARKMADA